MSVVAYIVAVVIFVLVAFGVDFEDFTALQLTGLGLAVFALAHVLPNGLSIPRRG